MFLPYIFEEQKENVINKDLISKFYNERIIFLFEEINDNSAMAVISQLLYLDSISDAEITLYINSPGGSVTAGLAIYDTMNFIKSDVKTICVGMAASMASIILAAGTKGKRFALPNSDVLIHQPLGGVSGQATDIEIVSKRILGIKKRINTILANLTNQSIDKIVIDTERDNYMTSEEAVTYGIIDGIITKQK